MKNPFKYGGIVSGPYFADRSEEIKELAREMDNDNRVFLVSHRQFGKTCLLHHLKESLEKDGFACAYLDLNTYPDLRSFAGAITSMTTKALESNTDKLLKIFSGFSKLRPKRGMDTDGNLSAGLENVKNRVRKSRIRVAQAANKELIQLYWWIGKGIAEKQEQLGWGKSVVEQLSQDLRKTFSGRSGFSVQNLWYMRQFHL